MPFTSVEKRNLAIGALATVGVATTAYVLYQRSKAKKSTPHDEAEKLRLQGNEYFRVGSFEEAVACYTQAIALSPDNHMFFTNRAVSYIRMNRFQDALADADEAIRLSPTQGRGYERRGQALHGLGRIEEAIEAFTKCLKLFPNQKAHHNTIKELKELLAQRDEKQESPRPVQADMNTAFVFIKPHAVTDATKKLVAADLAAHGITVLSEGSISSEEIDSKQLIDQHYYSIASKATILKPDQLNIPADKFEKAFGLSWEDALKSGRVFNARDGCAELKITPDQLDGYWAQCKSKNALVKFGGGFYCGRVEVEGHQPAYIFNGFFMSMRSKFTAPGGSIHYYVVEWDQSKLSWQDFRGKVLGPTDPSTAPADSLRGKILAQWKELGLQSAPNTGDNGVHASASPFEALAERMNWIGAKLEEDSFGKRMLEAGIPEAKIREWSVDPQVKLSAGSDETGSLFDQLEDSNSDECLAKCVDLSKL